MDPLWAELINSDWRDYRGSGRREDRLDSDAWLARFLTRTGWDGDRLPDTEQRQALKRLRRLLRGMVDAVRAEGVVDERDCEALNAVLAAAPLVRRLEQGEAGRSVVLVPVGGGIGQVMARVAAAFAEVLAEGEPERIKICANPDCGWVIYDESRNRSRRWCDASDCGNLIKVRRHRLRRRGIGAGGTSAGR